MRRRLVMAVAAAALAAGIILRVLVLLNNGLPPRYDLPPGMDEVNYLELVGNLRAHGRFAAWTGGFLSSSTRSPGYPVVLAAATMLGGGPRTAAPMLNLALDLLNFLLVYTLTRRLYGGVAAWTAACVYSLFGPVFLYLPLATPEILAVSLVMLVFLALVDIRNWYWPSAIALAVLYACLIHTRPVFLLVTPALALAVFLSIWRPGGGMPLAVCRAALPPFLAICLCLPWGIRNYRLHRAVVPVCTTAGWHLFNRGQRVENLSVETLTNYIYAPERTGFEEGEYFREGMAESRRMFLDEPIPIIANGTARLVYAWFLPRPLYRFLMPRAYLRRVFIGGGWFLPVPDAEGMFYLFAAFMGVSAAVLGRGIRAPLARWARRASPILVLLAAYILVHIIGFPLTQYRFTIEPALMVLGLGLVGAVVAAWRRNNGVGEGGGAAETADTPIVRGLRGEIAIPIIGAAVALAVLLAAAVHRVVPPSFDYPAIVLPDGAVDYHGARSMQKANLGNIPAGVAAVFAGMAKYPASGLRFPEGLATAVHDDGYSVATLVVEYLASIPGEGRAASFGFGDAKLNFRGTPPPHGQMIIIHGQLTTGAFKDIIVDVDKWFPLDGTPHNGFGSGGSLGESDECLSPAPAKNH